MLLVLMWLLLIRPQRRKQQEQQDLLSNVQIGDEIVTAGGIYGTVTDVDDGDVTVEIAPGTHVRMAKRAIAGILNDDEEEEYEEDEDDEEGDEPEAEGHTEHEEPTEEEEGKEPELDRSAAEQRG